MIEKYFLKGVRLRWDGSYDAPVATMDGTIVNNPTPPSRPITYDGLDGELINASLGNGTAVGLSMRAPVPHSWLSYSVGRTTKKLLAAGDVLTGYMSGCPIATWTENGLRYAGHVGTYDANPAVNTLVRKTFADFMPNDTVGFNPAGAWGPGDIGALMGQFKNVHANPRFLALVTTAGAFYSILMFNLGAKNPKFIVPAGSWCVGGAKLVAPMGYQALKRWLVPTAIVMGRRGL